MAGHCLFQKRLGSFPVLLGNPGFLILLQPFDLRRAFQVAGARTLIMSLWSVEDESARDWMNLLYRGRLQEGMNTADAVRQCWRHLVGYGFVEGVGANQAFKLTHAPEPDAMLMLISGLGWISILSQRRIKASRERRQPHSVSRSARRGWRGWRRVGERSKVSESPAK